ILRGKPGINLDRHGLAVLPADDVAIAVTPRRDLGDGHRLVTSGQIRAAFFGEGFDMTCEKYPELCGLIHVAAKAPVEHLPDDVAPVVVPVRFRLANQGAARPGLCRAAGGSDGPGSGRGRRRDAGGRGAFTLPS